MCECVCVAPRISRLSNQWRLRCEREKPADCTSVRPACHLTHKLSVITFEFRISNFELHYILEFLLQLRHFFFLLHSLGQQQVRSAPVEGCPSTAGACASLLCLQRGSFTFVSAKCRFIPYDFKPNRLQAHKFRLFRVYR